jgi:hypothetical protein
MSRQQRTNLNHSSVELEFFLRPTVSRPVRLGIGPPFGTLDQILSCFCFLMTIALFLILRRPL